MVRMETNLFVEWMDRAQVVSVERSREDCSTALGRLRTLSDELNRCACSAVPARRILVVDFDELPPLSWPTSSPPSSISSPDLSD